MVLVCRFTEYLSVFPRHPAPVRVRPYREYRVYRVLAATFFRGREFQVIPEIVREVVMWIGWPPEFGILEMDLRQRKDNAVRESVRPANGRLVGPLPLSRSYPLVEGGAQGRHLHCRQEGPLQRAEGQPLQVALQRQAAGKGIGTLRERREEGVEVPQPMLGLRLHYRGEDVDEDGLRVGVGPRGLVHVAVAVADLYPGAAEARIALGGLEEHVGRQLRGGDGAEPKVVLPRHEDVDIVIPGDEATMPDRSKEGAGIQPVAEAMVLAYRVERLEEAEHDKLGLPEGRVALKAVVGRQHDQW